MNGCTSIDLRNILALDDGERLCSLSTCGWLNLFASEEIKCQRFVLSKATKRLGNQLMTAVGLEEASNHLASVYLANGRHFGTFGFHICI